MTYLNRFNKTYEELLKHPEIEVLKYKTYDPIKPEVIDRFEKEMEISLDDSIHSFYNETNGLELWWIWKKDKQYDKTMALMEEENMDFTFPVWEGFGNGLTGCIHLLPFQETFFKDWDKLDNKSAVIDFWEEDFLCADHRTVTYSFLNEEIPVSQLRRMTRLLDLYSLYGQTGIIIDSKYPRPIVVSISDHWSWISKDYLLDFATYLELLIASKGLVDFRFHFQNSELAQKNRNQLLKTPKTFFDSEQYSLDSILKLYDSIRN